MVVFIGWFLFFCTFDPWALAFRRARETRVAAGKYHAMIRVKIHLTEAGVIWAVFAHRATIPARHQISKSTA
jgi:hypothetical protein